METINCSYFEIKNAIGNKSSLNSSNNSGIGATKFTWDGPGFSVNGPFLQDGSETQTPITGQEKLFWNVEGNLPPELEGFKVGQETPTIEEVRMLQQRAGIKRG